MSVSLPNAHSGASHSGGGQESARLLAQAGWSRVLDSVLRGLRHDLNSRLASLDAIVMLTDLGGLEQPLAASVASELDRLSSVVQVLGLLPGDLDADPIPVMPQEIVARAIQLAGTATHVVDRAAELEVEEGVPPVLANEARALRSTVLLLHRLLAHSSAGLHVVVSGDEQNALVTLRPHSTGEEPDEKTGAPIGLASGPEAEALEALLRLDGGELCRDDLGVMLRFASLARARAEGR